MELGLLLWLGHRRNGRFSLRGVVGHLGRPLPRGKLPGAWLVWRKKDLRVTLGMHPGTTFIMQTLGVLALALNLMP